MPSSLVDLLLVLGFCFPWLLIAAACWALSQSFRQNGRILLRLEELERRFEQASLATAQAATRTVEAIGLPLGSPAPDFDLPALLGGRSGLGAFRGHWTLLIFFDPICGFCSNMADDLSALPADGDGLRPAIVLVSTGHPEANRKLAEGSGLRCPILVQERMEVASRYGVNGTPMGYLIDAEGKIASALVAGSVALLRMAEPFVVESIGREIQPPAPQAKPAGEPSRGLERSRLKRDGLDPGTPAPDFTLPRVGGGELSLGSLRGSRILLVFSDPECGPCDALAPRLESLHRGRDDLAVVMVSRRGEAANAAKVGSLGLTFPVLLQKQWEVSLLYAMFATPVGYLIDEGGTIVGGVAIGPDPILALASGSSARSTPPELSGVFRS